MIYETVAARSARTGEPPHLIRRDAAAGRIPGAIRIGAHRSPWSLPVTNDDTPAPIGAGVSRTQTGGPSIDLMSTGGTTDQIATARRVAQRVAVVHTRPAQALADLAYAVAAVAAGHRIDRDGMCAVDGNVCPFHADRVAVAA